MNNRAKRWLLLSPLALTLGGCTGVRESSFAIHAARAVISAHAYDAVSDAMRSGDNEKLRSGVDALAKASDESGAALRLSTAENAVIEAVRSEMGTAKQPPALRLEAQRRSSELYRHALALAPDFPSENAQLLNALGYFLADRGSSAQDFALAEKLTRRAVEKYTEKIRAADIPALHAERSTIRDSLAWALFKLGKLDEAEREQRAAVRESSESDSLTAELPLHLAEILAKAGKTAEARAAYQQTLKLPQNEPDAHDRARAALAKLS